MTNSLISFLCNTHIEDYDIHIGGRRFNIEIQQHGARFIATVEDEFGGAIAKPTSPVALGIEAMRLSAEVLAESHLNP